MNKSESITKLAAALVKAQAEMPVVKMNAVNPFLKNKYADLGAVIETTRPTLARHGLAIAQTPTSDGERIGLTTLLVHESGEWIEETIYLPAGNSKGLSDAQNAGVAISYLRRYSWSSVLGLYADEDNDAQAPAKQPEKKSLRERYNDLLKEAQTAGVDVSSYQLTDKISDKEISELGKELRAKVDALKGKSNA